MQAVEGHRVRDLQPAVPAVVEPWRGLPEVGREGAAWMQRGHEMSRRAEPHGQHTHWVCCQEADVQTAVDQPEGAAEAGDVPTSAESSALSCASGAQEAPRVERPAALPPLPKARPHRSSLDSTNSRPRHHETHGHAPVVPGPGAL